MTRAVSGVLVEGVSFSALLPLKWSPPAKGNRPILPHEQIIFGNGRRAAVVQRERISRATNRHVIYRSSTYVCPFCVLFYYVIKTVSRSGSGVCNCYYDEIGFVGRQPGILLTPVVNVVPTVVTYYFQRYIALEERKTTFLLGGVLGLRNVSRALHHIEAS
ncbi:hypothetical protein DBV15_08694 [Temnothorax longispinosus]|uniref:Uncharacterized protein n=1 Tax=Temnothorax longispinosus TaxID=300112 RepID=A0A4V3SAI0_9HYME|nr:hypothetical protein DBV15_08694 [Temnothorax longispinosus]